jgi:histidinol dehydrogenase
MNIVKNPEENLWKELLQRPSFDTRHLDDQVRKILEDVKENGDKAVISYTKKYDGVHRDPLQCSAVDIKAAKYEVSDELKAAIDEAKRNIQKFHTAQVTGNVSVETTPGVRCWQKTVPIQKVGLYIPGGTAPLISTALMLGIPARLAGCREVVLCTPPKSDGKVHDAILYIAELIGIDKVFGIGGVQAIAAMAYGTESVPAVNKIFGPGNQYVTAAKQLVSRESVAIDMPAGPSELAIIADDSAHPGFLASDLLSQAEHGADSQVILVTDSAGLIDRVRKEVDLQLAKLPRKELAEKALNNSKLIQLDGMESIVRMINAYAPEHLIISCRNQGEVADQIVNAGSIFLGRFTPESAGDYASGTNHTLPTNGWAHAYGGLNMDSFVKKITFQEITRYGLFNIGDAVMELAAAEELQAHSNAVRIRLQSEEE